jgi:hypothetical protein
VGQRGQELVLQTVRALGRRSRRLGLTVEAGIVHGDGRMGREARDQALVTLVEEPGIGMSEEKPPQQVAGARAHGSREIAACGQTAGWHLLEGHVLAVARVLCEVVAPRHRAEEGRSEGVGLLDERKVDEGFRGSSGDIVRRAVGPIFVQEGPECGARDGDAGVGHGLDQPLHVELTGEGQAEPVEGLELRLELPKSGLGFLLGQLDRGLSRGASGA